jgi:O-antigen/teichoic acid export membrane protein
MSSRGLAKNIFSVGIIQVANYLFPLITVPIVSRIIGPEKFGVINFAAAFVAYFTLFIGYGFDLTGVRRILKAPNDIEYRSKVFNEVFQSQVLLLLISLVIYGILIVIVPQLREEKLVAIFTFLACFATVITQNWLFQAMQDLSKIAVLSLVSKVLFTVIILLVVHKRADYVWQPLAVSFSTIVVSIISFIWSIKRYKLKLSFVSIKTCLGLLWNERFFFISMIVINIYTTTNVVFLGLFHDAKQVGYYTAGIKVITIFQSIISMTLSQAFFPFVGKAFSESREKGIITCQKILPLVIISTMGMATVFFLIGPYALHILYGPAFTPSIIVFQILIFTPAIIAFSTVLGIHVMLNLGMDKLFFRISCIGAVVSVIINLVFVRPYGFIASALTLFSIEFLMAIIFYIALKINKIEIFKWEFFKPNTIRLMLYNSIKRKAL